MPPAQVCAINLITARLGFGVVIVTLAKIGNSRSRLLRTYKLA
jgi:hypothetical protein